MEYQNSKNDNNIYIYIYLYTRCLNHIQINILNRKYEEKYLLNKLNEPYQNNK